MKDRHLYRGMNKDGGWEIGHLIILNAMPPKRLETYIVLPENFKIEVSPETLGQCTGERDRNGKLIFEGDKIKFNESFGIDRTLTIAWLSYTLRFVICDESSVVMDFLGVSVVMDFLGVNGLDFEVVGNIHEDEK